MIGRRTERGPEAIVVPERMLAGTIDTAAVALLVSIVALQVHVFGHRHAVWPDVLVSTAIVAVYFIGSEWAFGRTLGKRLLGLRIYTSDGRKPGLVRVAVRNVLRVVDVLPWLYFVGLLSISMTSRAQRLGDLTAGTVVRHGSFDEVQPSARSEKLGLVALAGFVGLLLVVALPLSAFMGWIAEDDGGRVTILLMTILGIAFAAGIIGGDDHARYGALALVGCIIATVVAGGFWSERLAIAADYRPDIMRTIAREIPIGSTEEQAVQALMETDAYLDGPRVADEDDARPNGWLGDAAPGLGDRFVSAYFSNAFSPPWYCSEGDLFVTLIFTNGLVSEVRSEERLGGCL